MHGNTPAEQPHRYSRKGFLLHRSDEFEGNRIGLDNVHRIVNRHVVRTWSEVNRDLVFYFLFPNRIEEPVQKWERIDE